MKGKCPQCGEVVALPDAEPIVVKEPCQCGVTEVSLCVKYVAMGAASLVLMFLGGCWIDNYYSLEAVKAAPGQFKIVPNHDVTGPRYKVEVEPKTEPKTEPK